MRIRIPENLKKINFFFFINTVKNEKSISTNQKSNVNFLFFLRGRFFTPWIQIRMEADMWIQDSDPHYNLCGSTLLLLSRIIVEKFVLLLQGWTRTRSYGLPPSSTLSTISPNGGTISRLSYSQVSHHQARNYIPATYRIVPDNPPDIRKGRISEKAGYLARCGAGPLFLKVIDNQTSCYRKYSYMPQYKQVFSKIFCFK